MTTEGQMVQGTVRDSTAPLSLVADVKSSRSKTELDR